MPPMLLELRVLALRVVKIFKKPLAKWVPIPRPVLLVGAGSTARLCGLVGGSGARRTLIATDTVLARLGLVEPVRRALEAEGIDVAVFDGIVPDPPEEVLQAGLAALRAHGSDSIVALGGGSSIDAAKVIAAMATTGKSPGQLVGMLKVNRPPLPLFAVPTTAGTGSEVTVVAVVTDSAQHEKKVVIDPKLVPVAAALDPEMMKGMPPSITAATGMDALTHAVEAYQGGWPQADTAMLCVSAVRLVFSNLPRAYSDGGDLEAREAMALASLYAGLAFTRAAVGYVHAFSHKLGGMYGVPHGLANAIVLPKVLDFSKDAPRSEARLAELAVAIGSGSASEPKAVLAQRFVDRVRELNRLVGIPEKVDALRAEDIPAIARAACIEGARDYPVPKNMNLREAETLLRACLK
jgi:alcohol dehydrogenase class IV